MSESDKHKLLKQIALRWLHRTGCVAFACEISLDFVGIVDAAGIKASGDVYVVEAKASTRDMRADVKRRKMAKLERAGRIDFIYYIVAEGVPIDLLPDFVGILDERGRVKKRAKRRNRAFTTEAKLAAFERFARVCSWRAYGYVIRDEQEQLEFSMPFV